MADIPRDALDAAVAVAAEALKRKAQDNHATLARVSHVAALAAERLEAVEGDGPGAVALADVLVMLREIQNDGHLAYLRQQGSEADYQKAGAKARSRFQTPNGKWRRLAP